jgi:hypothetical protein
LDAVQDFEDLVAVLERHRVRHLVIGGLAFIYHAKPRYTKGMDLWIGPDADNVARANRALAEFGSPTLLDPARGDEILQLGVAPNRIDLLRETGLDFDAVWAGESRDATGVPARRGSTSTPSSRSRGGSTTPATERT